MVVVVVVVPYQSQSHVVQEQVVVEADPSQIADFQEQVVVEADPSQIQEQVVEEQRTVELVVEQVLVVGG
jgi:hypothetical protein